MIDKDKINIACNFTCLKYEKLVNFFNSGEISVDKNNKFLIFFDISYLLSVLENISKVDADTGFTDSNLDKYDLVKLIYGIINSAAHYRHFVSSKLRCSSVLIIYSSEDYYYQRYPEVFKYISKILNLFKKTIVIEKLENDSIKLIYQHIAYFTAMNISLMNNKINKKCRIMYIGNNELAAQMLRVDKQMIHIKHDYITSGLDVFFYKYITPEEASSAELFMFMSPNIVTTLLSLLGFKSGFDRLQSLKNKNSLKIIKTIIDNSKDEIDKDNINMILRNIKLSEEDIELFRLRLRLIDVDFLNNLYTLSKKLINIWSSKLETNKIHSFNDFVEFKDLTLNIQWLTE